MATNTRSRTANKRPNKRAGKRIAGKRRTRSARAVAHAMPEDDTAQVSSPRAKRPHYADAAAPGAKAAAPGAKAAEHKTDAGMTDMDTEVDILSPDAPSSPILPARVAIIYARDKQEVQPLALDGGGGGGSGGGGGGLKAIDLLSQINRAIANTPLAPLVEGPAEHPSNQPDPIPIPAVKGTV